MLNFWTPPPTALRTQLRPGDHFNALLGFPGLSVHQDSPGDLLHLVLLGLDRYEWFFTSGPWNESKDAWFAAGLRSSSVDGLNLSPVDSDYLVSYKNNLVGRHFKIITQLAIFHLHWVGVDRLWFDLWKATGALNALLWYPEIQDVTQYTVTLNLVAKRASLISTLFRRQISKLRSQTSWISGLRSTPTASSLNLSFTSSPTLPTTSVVLDHPFCTKLKVSKAGIKFSVHAACSRITTHLAVISP